MSAVPLQVPADPAPQPSMRRVRLHGPGAWQVVSGYVDVFASLIVDPAAPGRRHHLFRANAGWLLFELPPSASLCVEAVGTGTTVWTQTTTDAIDDRLTDAGRRSETMRALERWVDQLCHCVATRMPPHGCIGQDAGQDMTLTAGECVRPASGVMAVDVLSGSANPFGGDVPVGEGDVIALSSRAWLQMVDDGRLRLSALSTIVERGEVWSAISTFHETAMGGLARRLHEVRAAERAQYANRMTAAVDAGASALGMLAASFRNTPIETLTPVSGVATAHDRLNAACRMVAARLDVPFVVPAATSYRNIREGVENVARATKLRARHVTLEPRWWSHEQGPLLGFRKADSQPVALLPRSRGGYDLVDIDQSPPRRVDADVAASLSPVAVTFYRPFSPGPVSFMQLLRFSVHGCRKDVVMILTTGALAGVIGIGIPIATGVLINSIIPSTDRTQLLEWTLILLVCALTTAMFNLARSIALIRLEMKLGYAIQAAVWDRLISLPARFFRDYSAGNLATRAMGIDAVRQTLSGATIRGALAGVFSIFNFALMFYYDLPLALAGAAVIAVAVTILVTVAYLQRIQQQESVSIQARKSGVMLQLLTGIRKLRVASAEMRAFALWADLFGRQRRAKARIAWLGGIWKVFAVTMPLISLGVLVTVILMTSNGDKIKTGDFLAFMAAFTGCVSAILGMAGAAIGALSILPQYEMAQPILQSSPEISVGQADPGELAGEIAVDRVVFAYQPDAPPVLNDLTFRVQPGEFVAFVGPSGSGKSTILRLLLGFETPQSGAVSYDSRDLKELDVRAVRRQIGVVLQSGRLTPGDIYTNIVGCSAASMEDAWSACRRAGFDEDLKRMPMGMHTMITDGGGTLSGGQRQRLMIARAIVTSPRMLFFDEATSALDNHTQAIVSQSLDRLRATRIVIAHRLSTIINADRICVVDKGRIVQSGTYEELMTQPGPFRELANRQLA